MNSMDIMIGPYKAVMQGEWEGLVEELKDKSKIAFPMTTSGDTALHMAVHSGTEDPLRGFLAALEGTEYREFWRNNAGNTPLHEAATIGNLAAVKLLVEFNKEDLLAENIYGETPMFRAARCGHNEIVKYFLEDCEDFFSRSPTNWITRKDNPIIHAAIQSEQFEVVSRLAEFDKSLLEKKDSDGRTALYLLANMPHVFKSGYTTTYLGSIVYSMLPSEDIDKPINSNFGPSNNNESESSIIKNMEGQDLEATLNSNHCHSNCWRHLLRRLIFLFWRLIFIGWPHWKIIYEKKRQHELALSITKTLAEIDDSWRASVPPPKMKEVDAVKVDREVKFPEVEAMKVGREVKFSELETMKVGEVDVLKMEPPMEDSMEKINEKYVDHHATPLFLAASNGIIEIIHHIIQAHPQAIDYVTPNNRNFLHVTIAHRQMRVFDWIQKQRFIMNRLISRIDVNGFTPLHHVAITKFYRSGTQDYGPALQLQQELKWFERVKEEIPALYKMHHSKIKLTAKQLFDQNHEKMLEDGKEWLKKTSESCSAVGVLIATVVFAAAFTVPGGLDSRTGSPILLTQPVYIVFTVMDIVGLATSLTSVVLFLSILMSSFEMDEFLHKLPLKLSFGFQLLFISVATTMLAFALTIVLTMKTDQLKWTVSLLYLSTFFPVGMFVIIQLPLYMDLVQNIWSYRYSISQVLPLGFVSHFWKLSSNFFTKKRR